jgi:hypothetical protein
MVDKNKSPSSAQDFLQLAQQLFARARANLERARVLTEMGETYVESARIAERSALKSPDTPPPVDRDPRALH